MYIVILILLCTLALASPWIRQTGFAIALLFGVALFALTIFRNEDVADDYSVYQEIVKNSYTGTSDKSGHYNMEPAFAFPLLVSREIFDLKSSAAFQVTVVMFAVVAFGTKFLVFRLSRLPVFLCLLIYYSYFFFLHEMVQMRAGAAIGILMLAMLYYVKGQNITFVGLVLTATVFHLSSILFLSIFLLKYFKSINRAALATVGCLMFFGVVYSTSSTQISIEQSSIGILNRGLRYFAKENQVDMPFFGLKMITQIAITLLCYFPAKRLEHSSRLVTLLFHSQLLALIIYCLMFFSPIAAYRAFDVISCTQPLLLAGCVFAFEPKLQPVYIFLLCIFSSLMFYQIHYNLKIIRPFDFDPINQLN